MIPYEEARARAAAALGAAQDQVEGRRNDGGWRFWAAQPEPSDPVVGQQHALVADGGRVTLCPAGLLDRLADQILGGRPGTAP